MKARKKIIARRLMTRRAWDTLWLRELYVRVGGDCWTMVSTPLNAAKVFTSQLAVRLHQAGYEKDRYVNIDQAWIQRAHRRFEKAVRNELKR